MARPDIPDDSSTKFKGQLFFWQYEPGYSRQISSGWHMTLDPEGAASMAEILPLIRSYNRERKRNFPVTKPITWVLAVPNYGRAKALAPRTLSLTRDPYADPDHWQLALNPNRDAVDLEMGPRSFDRLIDGIAAIQRNGGDYSIGKPALWFWWYLK